MSDAIEKARKRVKAKKDFYGHLGSFIAVNGFLFLLNWLVSPHTMWFIYPLLGWSIGLVTHYFSVFGLPGMDPDWEEKEMDKELRRLNSGKQKDKDDDSLELKVLDKQKSKWKDDELV